MLSLGRLRAAQPQSRHRCRVPCSRKRKHPSSHPSMSPLLTEFVVLLPQHPLAALFPLLVKLLKLRKGTKGEGKR